MRLYYMKKALSLSILCGLVLLRISAYGQNKTPAKFGKVTPADFDLSAQKFDSGAAAVVIADIGNSAFIRKAGFSLEFNHFRRMKILSTTGLQAATVVIPLYSSNSGFEKLEIIKAVTYNLENGQVVATKLDDRSVFTERMSKHWTRKKFTFPAVKQGSIIEYSYTETSPFFFNLQPWAFQGEYPCFWSEYSVNIPEYFDYVFFSQGYLPFDVDKSSTSASIFDMHLEGIGTVNVQSKDHLWIIKNVPAFREEVYTTTLRNYISAVEFQLAQVNIPNSPIKYLRSSWGSVSQELFEDEYFGADLNRNNGWLDDEMGAITKGAVTPLEKAIKIYTFVRDRFACTGHNALFANNPIKTIFYEKSGNAAGLNLLLDAMLSHEHLDADPVILSTRSNGFVRIDYPKLDRFNYVVCRLAIDSSVYYLDASQPWMGFGHIPEYCYNGPGRVMDKDFPKLVTFAADAVSEGKMTTVFLSSNDKGGFEGSYQSVEGYFESSRVREKVRQKGEKAFFDAIRAAYTDGAVLSNMNIDSLNSLSWPVKIAYDFTLPHDSTADIIYFNPMLATDSYKTNPFTASKRNYPVEMPNAVDEVYIFNMDVPAGYEVEELPRSDKVLFNTDEGFFEYIVQKDETSIQLRSRLKLLKANFKPEDYNVLRDFYTFVVKKESEQIVFKKKK